MLRKTLIANALSCAVFGALFVLASGEVSHAIGDVPKAVIMVIGIGLIANAVLLSLESRRDTPRPAHVRFFAIGDFLWVIATLGLVLGGVWITSPFGVTAALIVATMVGIFGVLQMRHS